MPASFRRLRRCLLRHQATRTWFADGEWVANPHEAFEFEDLTDIAHACDIYQLKDVEIVFRGMTEDQDVAVPLSLPEVRRLNGELASEPRSALSPTLR